MLGSASSLTRRSSTYISHRKTDFLIFVNQLFIVQTGLPLWYSDCQTFGALSTQRKGEIFDHCDNLIAGTKISTCLQDTEEIRMYDPYSERPKQERLNLEYRLVGHQNLVSNIIPEYFCCIKKPN